MRDLQQLVGLNVSTKPRSLWLIYDYTTIETAENYFNLGEPERDIAFYQDSIPDTAEEFFYNNTSEASICNSLGYDFDVGLICEDIENWDLDQGLKVDTVKESLGETRQRVGKRLYFRGQMPPPDLVASFPWKPHPWSRQKESSELEPPLEQKSSLELEASLGQEESPGLEMSSEQKALPEPELPLEPDASLKIPRIHAVEGENPQGRIRSFLLDMSRGLEYFKQRIDDHYHTQDSSHDEPSPHLRADEKTLQIRFRLLSLQDELRTFIHLLEVVEEEAVEKDRCWERRC